MKKTLLLLLILFAKAETHLSFAQTPAKPTVKLEMLNNHHCENNIGTATIRFILSGGSGDYDVVYNVKNQHENSDRYLNHVRANIKEVPFDATSTTSITIKTLTDSNGTPGDIIGNPIGTITIDKMPTGQISDQVKTCRHNITLNANPGLEYTSAAWEPTVGGTFDDVSKPNATFTANADGNYTLTYMVKNGTCTAPLQKTFTIAYQPPPSADISITDEKICEGASTSLNLTNVTGRQGMVLNYNEGSQTIAYPFTANNISIPLQPTENTDYTMLSLVDKEGCSQPLTKAFNVQVDLTPIANAGSVISECDTLISLNAQIQNPVFTGEWTPIPGLNFLDNINNKPNAKIWIPKSGQLPEQTYDLQWTVWNKNNVNCVDKAHTQVNFYKQPENVDAGNDTTLYLEDEIYVEASGYEEGMLGQWKVLSDKSEKPDIEDEFSDITRVTNLKIGDNQLEWKVTNTELCVSRYDTITIKVKGIYDPTGFSPNGDGINEFFIIGGAKMVTNNKLVVIDINGKQIFSTTNFCWPNSETPNGWNARNSDGSTVEDGTYYYIFTGDDIDPVKNFLIIKRDK